MAKKFTPFIESGGDDLRFETIHRKLIQDFAPTTYLGRELVSFLAHDLLQLAHCRRMMELQLRPAALPGGLAADYQRLRDAQHDLKMIGRVQLLLETRRSAEISRKTADRIATLVGETIQAIDEFIHDPDGLPEDQMADDERRAYRAYSAAWSVIKPCHKKLIDTAYIAQVLLGARRPTPIVSRGVVATLEQAAANCRRVVDFNKNAERRVVRQQDDQLWKLAREPEGLMVLQRYATRLEIGIQRKMCDLRQL